MSFPVTWLSAAALPSVPMLGETAKNLSSSTAQAFGNLLQNLTSPANGLSEANSTPNQPKLDGPLERDRHDPDRQIKTRLSELISRVKKSLGLGASEQNVTVVADGWGIPKVEGNPLLNTHVQSQLEQDPDLIALINQRARNLADPYFPSASSSASSSAIAPFSTPESTGDPLRWLPQRPMATSSSNLGPRITPDDSSANEGFSTPVTQPNSSSKRASWTVLG
jgi:hypothetical protein